MGYDPRVESEAHYLAYVLGENRGEAMKDKDRHDIFSTIRRAVAYWKDKYLELLDKNYEGKYKAVRLFLLQYPEATVDDVRNFILHLDMDGVKGSRDLRPKGWESK